MDVGGDEDWEFTPGTGTNWSMEDIDMHPLFMTEMPEDASGNPALQAIQEICAADETPESMAANHKRVGNECLDPKHGIRGQKQALLYYTEGLNVRCKDAKLNCVLHSNRAQVALKLKEWARALNDAHAAVRFDPNHVKSYWRGATAAAELELWRDAEKLCTRGLSHGEDPALRSLLEKVEPHLRRIDASQAQQAKTQQRAATALEVALDSREVVVGPPLYDGMYSGKVQLVGGQVRYPVLFLYDETMASDFIAEASETSCLAEHVAVMFPANRSPEWDHERKYCPASIVVFLEVYSDTRRTVPEWEKPEPEDERPTKMIPVGTDTPLSEIVTGHELPAVVVIHALVRGTPALAEFEERFLR